MSAARPGAAERGEPPVRGEWQMRGERPELGEQQVRGEPPERSETPVRGDRPLRGEPPERGAQQERTEGPERGEACGQGEPPVGVESPMRGEPSVQGEQRGQVEQRRPVEPLGRVEPRRPVEPGGQVELRRPLEPAKLAPVVLLDTGAPALVAMPRQPIHWLPGTPTDSTRHTGPQPPAPQTQPPAVGSGQQAPASGTMRREAAANAQVGDGSVKSLPPSPARQPIHRPPGTPTDSTRHTGPQPPAPQTQPPAAGSGQQAPASGTTRREAAGGPARLVGLDLLRGFSVLLVMMHHAFPQVFPGGGVVGVVVFFVLSGYLMTRSILRDRALGRWSVRSYAKRRAVRLLPALWAMLAVYAVVTLVWDPLHDTALLPRTLVVALTYLTDMPIKIGSAGIFHLWTLAVEAQFYVLWPALLVLAARRHRPMCAVMAGAVASLTACVGVLALVAPDPDAAYRYPTSWAIALIIGAGAAVVASRSRRRDAARPAEHDTAMPSAAGQKPLFTAGAGPERRLWTWRVAAGAAVVGALLGLSCSQLRGHVWTYVVMCPVVAGLGVCLIRWWSPWVPTPSRTWVLPRRALVWVGTVSYGAYLWNYPLVLWLGGQSVWWRGLLATAATVLVASVSWVLLERPLQRRWSRRQGPRAA